MKNKLLLVLILIIVMTTSIFILSGCQSSIPLQNKLEEENLWFNKKLPEIFTYNVIDKENNQKVGTYIVSVNQVSANKTIYLGKDGTQDNENNAIYSINTNKDNDKDIIHATAKFIDNDNYSQETEVYFTRGYLLLGSYSKIIKDSKETIIVAKNEDNDRYYYTKFEDNNKIENKIKNGKYASSPYYDNVMIYLVARSIPNDTVSYNFKIFDTNTNSKINVHASIENKSIIEPSMILDNPSGFTVTMSTSDKLLGTVNKIVCYVSNAKIHSGNEYFKNVIVKIVEGNYEYQIIL